MNKGLFMKITANPKVWGVRVFGKGKKGMRVEVMNRQGSVKVLTLASKVADVPANPYNNTPESELWSFTDK